MPPDKPLQPDCPMNISATLLVDDLCTHRSLLGEHGLSIGLEIQGARVLFDAGQGRALEHNAGILNWPLENLDAIVLSHGHDDHSGGLHIAVSRSPEARKFAHPEALKPKYSRKQGRLLNYSTPARSHAAFQGFVPLEKPTLVVPGLWATGPVPRLTTYEDTGGEFFLDANATVIDPIVDDIALYAPTPTGTVVVLGCAHAGVINTLRYIQKLTEGAPIRAVFGGMHLWTSSSSRHERTAVDLADFGDIEVIGCHCTGADAGHVLGKHLGPAYRAASTGARFVWKT
jgi:7,8-dihydropterin-6-yl-methyl-4-(beta-D-ribofuranosyl)aminobenzene 5'-phosphate synthase